MNFDMTFTDKEKDILKKLSKNERMISYQDLLFKTGNPFVGNFGLLKRFGSLYNLLIYLLSEEIRTLRAAKEQTKIMERWIKWKN